MINFWFSCKIKYTTHSSDGKEINKKEQFYIQAYNYIEAETEISIKMEQMYSNMFFIDSISKSNITDIFLEEDTEKFYKVRLKVFNIDPTSKKEKESIINYIIGANNCIDAVKNIEKHFEKTIGVYTIMGLQEINILEVYPKDINSGDSSDMNIDLDTGELLD